MLLLAVNSSLVCCGCTVTKSYVMSFLVSLCAHIHFHLGLFFPSLLSPPPPSLISLFVIYLSTLLLDPYHPTTPNHHAFVSVYDHNASLW